MLDREKIIEGFEMSYRYSNVDDGNTLVPQQLVLDALALLKAQEPRVMTLEELPDWDGAFLIETRVKATVWASWYSEYELYGETVCRMVDIGGEVDDRLKKRYGYEWRVWTSRPTDEQREAKPWE